MLLDLRVDDLDVPNCPDCLARLEVAGTVEHPYWWCPMCAIVKLS